MWSKNFIFQKSFQISNEVERSIYINKSTKYLKKEKKSLWITDAVLFPGNHILCVATSRSDLRFFTVSTEHFIEEFCINNFKDVITCLDYNYDVYLEIFLN